MDVTRIADACGYGVPLMTYEAERPHHDAWAQKKLRTGGEEAIAEYKREKNSRSLDGLPAVEPRDPAGVPARSSVDGRDHFRTPDVLVLGGGGVLGEAWMNAVLAGIEDATGFDARDCSGYVGTSAGSIVAAALAAGARPDARLGELPEQPADDGATIENGNGSGAAGRALRAALAMGGVAAAPVAGLALTSITPGGALARRVALGRMAPGTRSLGGLGQNFDRRGVRFDGRLAVAAVALHSGRRVMFGQPGAPDASVGDAVGGVVRDPGVLPPDRDRRPQLRRRRRLEPHEHGRGAPRASAAPRCCA